MISRWRWHAMALCRPSDGNVGHVVSFNAPHKESVVRLLREASLLSAFPDPSDVSLFIGVRCVTYRYVTIKRLNKGGNRIRARHSLEYARIPRCAWMFVSTHRATYERNFRNPPRLWTLSRRARRYLFYASTVVPRATRTTRDGQTRRRPLAPRDASSIPYLPT